MKRRFTHHDGLTYTVVSESGRRDGLLLTVTAVADDLGGSVRVLKINHWNWTDQPSEIEYVSMVLTHDELKAALKILRESSPLTKMTIGA